jgi:NAD(P)-dependent dehydrogenase (short-subunit alcohol dehydrogenase family)
MNDESKVILVTGATDGIGRETALELARRGARVLVHGRDPARAREAAAAVAEIRREAALEPLVVDLSRLGDVRAAGAELDRRGLRIEALVNNAGVYMRERRVSVDGFELTFAVNHLAPFALTHALLRAEAGRSLARIVNVSSMAHARGTIDLDDLSYERRPFDPYGVYASSKLANVLFTVELDRRLRAAGRAITVNALHPGVVSTKLLTEGFGVRGPDSLGRGAATSVRLALDADLAKVSGRYFSDGQERPMSRVAGDVHLAQRFYERSAQLCRVEPLAAAA